MDLLSRTLKLGRGNLLRHPAPVQGHDRPVFLEDSDVPHRRMKRKLRHGRRFQITQGGCQTGAAAAVKGDGSGPVRARHPQQVRGSIFIQHTGQHEQMVGQPVEVAPHNRIDLSERYDCPLRPPGGDSRHMAE